MELHRHSTAVAGMDLGHRGFRLSCRRSGDESYCLAEMAFVVETYRQPVDIVAVIELEGAQVQHKVEISYGIDVAVEIDVAVFECI